MKICETFQANCLLDKLPPSWEGYVHSLKHKQKDFTLQELVSHIKIEEQNRLQLKGKTREHSSSTANLVESKSAGKFKGYKGKGPNQFHGTRNNRFNKDKETTPKRQFNGKCFTCGEFGHSVRECQKGHGPGV
jgi:hypothetical protein